MLYYILDDTVFETAHPGETFRPDVSNQLNIQRSFYSDFIKRHGLKSQTALFSDGMIDSIFIAALSNNDNGMLDLSALGDKLNKLLLLMPNDPPDCSTKYAIFCDGVFHTMSACSTSLWYIQMHMNRLCLNI